MIDWKSHENHMKQAVSATLENITFSIVEDIPEDAELEDTLFAQSYLSIELTDMTLMGRVQLPLPYLESVVTTLYPMAENAVSEYETDTINELVNTIFGNFFRLLESEMGIFSLSVPDPSLRAGKEILVTYEFLIDDVHKVCVELSQ